MLTGSPWQTTWTGSGTKTAGAGFSVAVGDLLVVLAATEDTSQGALPTPTNTGTATITWTAQGTVTAASHAAAKGWTGSVTGAGTVTVSMATPVPVNNWGFVAWGFGSANHGGVGAVPAGGSGTATLPSLTATWAANSFVCCINADWSAVTHGASRSYLTNVGAATERNYVNADGNYTTEAWNHADSGSGGSQAVGLSTPTMTWSLVAVEVLGTGGGSVTVKKIPTPRAAVFRSVR
jgi:hypothetical protein